MIQGFIVRIKFAIEMVWIDHAKLKLDGEHSGKIETEQIIKIPTGQIKLHQLQYHALDLFFTCIHLLVLVVISLA